MTPRAAAALGLVVCLLVAGVLALRHPGSRVPQGGPVTTPAPARTEPAPTEPAPTGPALRAAQVLEEWQEARARAYATGDVAALRALHVPGSQAGRRDVAVLRAYAARGVRLDLTARRDRLAVLVVRPRVLVLRERARLQVVARHAGRERMLPTDEPQWRRVVLRLLGGRWRLSSATETSGTPREPP
jgi:hypothetical protein